MVLVVFVGSRAILSEACRQKRLWQLEANRFGVRPTSSGSHRPTRTYAVPPKKTYEPGDINCRGWAGTYEEVNYYSCEELADLFDNTVEFFFTLNPQLAPDCEGIAPWT